MDFNHSFITYAHILTRLPCGFYLDDALLPSTLKVDSIVQFCVLVPDINEALDLLL